MPRFKPDRRHQNILVPISFEDQIVPGTFEHTLDLMIEEKTDLSVFDDRYCNDDTGAPAYNPAVLLKVCSTPTV